MIILETIYISHCPGCADKTCDKPYDGIHNLLPASLGAVPIDVIHAFLAERGLLECDEPHFSTRYGYKYSAYTLKFINGRTIKLQRDMGDEWIKALRMAFVVYAGSPIQERVTASALLQLSTI